MEFLIKMIGSDDLSPSSNCLHVDIDENKEEILWLMISFQGLGFNERS